ncbi:hypothetical protein K435DRAFT_698465 [Dendrothele bispora CBS 962.96]|uniref:Tc1-like transposase DDE domain-containing protein n=1 Tax=Dendrothele bispora (strain CBS 962.96) TaxID=1314807 RepID=A0A4S8KTJ6_DENBC|nr:hypothetical protein K435DRAFT_698465 [Dendrothele bispora CBS 962.96]
MAAVSLNRGIYCAKILRKLARQYIIDRTVLPINPFGEWKESMLADEDLCNDINLYLQEIGNDITAEKLVSYLARDDVREKHGISQPITVRTARRYLHTLGYRFTSSKKGQYSDGHERKDVVDYRDKVFLPRWEQIKDRIRTWTSENLPEYGPLCGKRIIVWYHDETIFYAHDRRRKNWFHKDASAKPYAKGDGHSFMIADYVSADFGWLRSLDGRSARRVMFPGKAKDGYFTAEDIQEQANAAIDLVHELYPDYEHIFIYDNATTHLKRPDGSLSARKMPKGPSSKFFIEVSKRDANGKLVYNPDGSIAKEEREMEPGVLPDGCLQSLYYPENHKTHPNQFKGMATILQERGYNVDKLKAQCNKKFNCAPPALNCCCRRILFNEPDFVGVESILEKTCKERGVQVIFLPKFHCELNPIEQCWGYGKRLYRFYPESSREEDLERNALECLDKVPLESIRRFFNRSHKFMDAYSKGLDGRQAAWAARKYRGHRVLPASLMADMEKENMK